MTEIHLIKKNNTLFKIKSLTSKYRDVCESGNIFSCRNLITELFGYVNLYMSESKTNKKQTNKQKTTWGKRQISDLVLKKNFKFLTYWYVGWFSYVKIFKQAYPWYYCTPGSVEVQSIYSEY